MDAEKLVEEWPWFVFHRMDKGNDSLWLWIDCKISRYWYVLIWRKKQSPYLYRSLDATPPMNDERGNNSGAWIIRQRAYEQSQQ